MDMIKIKLEYLASDAKLVFAPRKIKLLQIEDHFFENSQPFFPWQLQVVEEGLSSFGRVEFACCPWSLSLEWTSTEHQAHQPMLVFTTVNNYLLVKSELHAC